MQIVPNVAGRVTEIAVEAYTPMKKGDLLFRIDDRPYKAAVAAVEAQLVLARRRLEQSSELQRERAGSIYEVEAAETQVKSLEAQLDGALFNLENAEVRAPADGHVTSLALPSVTTTSGNIVMWSWCSAANNSDTVGFIRNLPHKLIASFKATLEEARQANLLLHVADGSRKAVIAGPSAPSPPPAAFSQADRDGERRGSRASLCGDVGKLTL